MKDFIYLVVVFFGTLILMHLFLCWACWMIGVNMTGVNPAPTIFIVDFTVAALMTMFAGILKSNPL